MPLPTRLIFLVALLLLAACAPAPAVVTWETASEVNTAGFNLYRGPGPDGPWTQVNASLIPPSSDPLQGGNYSFTDETAQPGERYYYQLEEVELSGASHRFPPTPLETRGRLPAWPLWLAAAGVAVLIGWWIGGRARPRKTEAAS